MSKPLPKCYYCGKTVARSPRVIFDFSKKLFAWHLDGCAEKDDKYFSIAGKIFSMKIEEEKGVAMLEAGRKKRDNRNSC